MTATFDDKVRAATEAALKRRGRHPAAAKADAEAEKLWRKTSADISRGEMKQLIKSIMKDSEQALRHDLNEVIENALNTVREQRIVLEQPNQVERQLDGLTHRQFPMLVKAAGVVDAWGNRKNIMLTGPMGSGKSTGGKNLAQLFDLPFDYIGQTNMPHIVVGSQHPLKELYKHTPFTTIFRDGGVIMFEELDAWNPNASLVLNVPLANGYLTLENGERIERHKDCIIIACANTWGTGATAEYVGRNKLDAAFLDRFAFKFAWGYDSDLERKAANNDMVVDAVQRARINAESYGIKVAISPRSSIDIADMVRHGWDLYDAMKMNFLAQCDYQTEKKLLEDVIY